MPIVLRQDVQLARLISRVEHGALRVRQSVRGLSANALNWRPPGGWSINQHLEHAIQVADPYLKHLPPVIKRNVTRRRFAKNGKWSVSVPGGILRWSLGIRTGSTLLARTPEPGENGLQRFLSRQKEVAQMLRSADGLRIDRIHCRLGGVVWWRLADSLTLLVVRTERDVAGVKRVRDHEDFPVETAKGSEGDVSHRG